MSRQILSNWVVKTSDQWLYMRLYTTSKNTGPPIYLYDYQITRARKHQKRFLRDFEGYLQTDGYSGYNDRKNISLLGCFAHVSRKFIDTLKAVPDKTSITHLSATKQKGLIFVTNFITSKKMKDLTLDEREKIIKILFQI